MVSLWRCSSLGVVSLRTLGIQAGQYKHELRSRASSSPFLTLVRPGDVLLAARECGSEISSSKEKGNSGHR